MDWILVYKVVHIDTSRKGHKARAPARDSTFAEPTSGRQDGGRIHLHLNGRIGIRLESAETSAHARKLHSHHYQLWYWIYWVSRCRKESMVTALWIELICAGFAVIFPQQSTHSLSLGMISLFPAQPVDYKVKPCFIVESQTTAMLHLHLDSPVNGFPIVYGVCISKTIGLFACSFSGTFCCFE